MKLFITGGTGVLGKRLVPMLVEKGHEVIVLSRSEEKNKLLEKFGAIPSNKDIFNEQDMVKVSEEVDGILHLATSIPSNMKLKPQHWEMNYQLRTKGTKILLNAALENKVKFYLQKNVTFGYGHKNDLWVDEETPYKEPVPTVIPMNNKFFPTINHPVRCEELVNDAIKTSGLPGINLRFSLFYSDDSHTTQTMIAGTKKRQFPLIKGGTSFVNLIHVEDAALAIVKTVDNYNKVLGKTYNVTDDYPVQYKELLAYIAEKVGSKPPRNIPQFLAKMVVGEYGINFVRSSVRVKNQRFKHDLQWVPKYPTFREGFNEVISNLK